METLVLEKGDSAFLINQARLVKATDDIADIAASTEADWNIDKSSPFVTWIAGDFVEGDNPNANKQFWTAGDLELAEYTIKYAPLNMVHKFREPVGFFAATKTISLAKDDAASLEEDEWLDIEDMHTLVAALETEGVEVEFVSTDIEEAKVPSGGNAPYAIVKIDKKFQVVNNAGEVKATFKTKKAAEAYQRALYANVPGAAKRATKVKWTGGAKLRGNKPMAGKHVGKDFVRVSKAEEAAALGEAQGSMKIQALSGLWSHLFPFETAQVESADDAGLLYYSMECRGTHLTCAGDTGCGETFEYADVENQCEHLQGRTSVRHIVNPTFRGGALIVPPVKPGWKQAHAGVLQASVMEEASRFAEQTQDQYASVAASGVDITTSAWEQLMALVLLSRES